MKNYIIKLAKAPILRNPYALTASMIFIMSEFISAICLHELYSGMFFTLFQIVGILLPGTALLIGFGWRAPLNWKACGLSYTIGYCLSLFEYFIIMLLGLKRFSVLAVAFVSLCSFIFLYIKCFKKKAVSLNVREADTLGNSLLIMLLCGAVFTLTFILSCCNNLVQPAVAECSPVEDMMYWIGNIVELTKEFPPKDFYNYPNDYSYHYFSSAQLALACQLTRIAPIYIGLYFSTVQAVLLRVFCGYIVLTKCTASRVKQIAGFVLLFFSSGFERTVVVSYLAHSYHASFGVEYAFSLFMMFIYLLIIKSEEKSNRLETSILIWICLFVLSGEKIAYGGVALAGLGVLCIVWMLTKKYSKAIVSGIPALVVFLLEYTSILNTSRYASSSAYESSFGTGSLFKPIYYTYLVGLTRKINNITSWVGLSPIPFFYIVFFALVSPVCFFAVLYNAWRLTKNKKWTALDVSFLSMYILGNLATILFTMYGGSNMYFAMVSYPAAIIWLIYCDLPWKKIPRILFLITSALSVTGFAMGYNSDADIIDYVSDGIYSIINMDVSPHNKDWKTYTDTEEYNAYTWVGEHSDEDSIIATNRTSKMLGALSERHTNDPRFENSFFTKETAEEKSEALAEYREIGVELIVYEDGFGGDAEYLNQCCNLVYQTENISIYELD